jgi:hypothetical protein
MAQEYIRQYNSFRGVDFTSDPVDVPDYRLQYAVNMWRDYENGNGNMIETIPGFRVIATNPAKFNGLHHYRTTDKHGKIIDFLVIHISMSLMYSQTENISAETFKPVRSGNSDAPFSFMENAPSVSVMSNNKLIMLDGEKIVIVEPTYVDEELVLFAKTSIPVENVYGESKVYDKYVPITYSDGKEYEAENLFSDYAIERYNNTPPPKPDASGILTYQIHSLDYDDEGFEITMGGEKISEYGFDKKTRQLSLQGFAQKEGEEGDGEIVATNYGQELIVKGKVKQISFKQSNKYPSFLEESDKQSAIEAISKCKKIAVFDKKLFFTGNPEQPNTVFFTSTDLSGNNNISYVGIYNFLYTGIGMTPNNAMVASQSVLMVFKGDTAQDGSIYYLSPFDVENDVVPRYYSVTEGAAGIGCIGGAINFMDDTVFISKRGLDAVGKQLTNLERSIVHRSSNVDRKLLAEDLKNVRMVEWKGYLVVSVGGHLYLADSRAMYADSTGNMQYEWFYLEGIGGYGIPSNSYTSAYKKQYRYWSGNLPEGEEYKGYSVKPNNNEEIVDEELITHDDLGIYFSKETDEDGNPANYLCYVDDEYLVKEGAKLYPAIELCVINDVLYFGTENGNIYCFNTDKRGEIPESIYKDGVWLDSNYDSKEDFVGWIPQEYYSFAGLKYPSGVITKTDNAGIPYATKNTINRSLVLRCGADPRTHSSIMVEVLTDRNSTFKEVDRKETSEQTFGMQDFSASTFGTYPFAFIAFREHERKWIEKKYKIYNDAFRGIIRLHSLSYRYEIGGNIK